jgi:hypothetical protein
MATPRKPPRGETGSEETARKVEQAQKELEGESPPPKGLVQEPPSPQSEEPARGGQSDNH